jgi:hypothetical protein
MMPEVNTKPVMPAGALINPQAYKLANTGPMAEQVSVGNILSQLPPNPPNTAKQVMHDCGITC